MTAQRSLRRLASPAMLSLAAIGFGVSHAAAQVCTVVETLKWTPPANTGLFGSAAAISGSRAIVGAKYFANDTPGTAFIFNFDGKNWTLAQILTPSDTQYNGNFNFGQSVAADGDYVVIGSPNNTSLQFAAGAAYVFHFDGSTWSQQAKLVPSDIQFFDHFGISVAIAGETIIVGSYQDDDQGNNAGSAYVFQFDGTNWVQQQKLLPSDGAASQQFGYSVAMDGNAAVIGRLPTGANPNAGAAYVFRNNGSGWVQEQKLVPSDGASGDSFGIAVAISNNDVVIGSPGHDQPLSNAGAAYVFHFDGTTWSQIQELAASDPGVGDAFGSAVGIDGDAISVGAPLDDVPFSQVHPITPDAGSAYLFRLERGTWIVDHWNRAHYVENDPTIMFNPNMNDKLGSSIAIGSGIVLACAPGDIGPAANAKGSALFFDVVPPDCDGNGVSDVCDPDCNHNLVNDACDIAAGTSPDCNGNGVPDECEAGIDYVIDDGIFGVVYGTFDSPIDLIWLNPFTVTPANQYITHIAVCWLGTTPEGTPGTLMLYDDPNNDGNPDDAVLLATAPCVGHDAFGLGPAKFSILPIARTYVGTVGKRFFVGALMSCAPNVFVAAADQTQPNPAQGWIVAAFYGQGNINDLTANDGILAPINGVFLLRAIAMDCNGNGIWDECDIASGFSVDADGNGIPDECESSCIADIAPSGGNGLIDVDDLLAVINAWGKCAGTPRTCPADIAPSGGDGVVNVDDLLLIINNWGPCS